MSDTTTVPSTPGGAAAAGAPPGGPSGTASLARLRGFHPGWYGAVMGTAVIGVAASMDPGGSASLASAGRTFGQVMAIAAAVLAAVLALGYLGRFIWHPKTALADLKNPALGALYSTVPGGILVLAAAAAAVGPTWFSPKVVRDLVVSFDWLGVPLAFLMSVVFAYVLFAHPGLGAEEVNGSWFIPPVANIVVPLVLAPLVPAATPAVARDLLITSYGFWGMGFLLYLFVMSMFHQRLVMSPLPHASLAPSIWIGLGPIGVGALALVKLSAVSTKAFGPAAQVVGLLSKLAATAIWGFGAWWLAIAAVLLVRYLAHRYFPYSVGWWAFTFPLGAYTVATLSLAKAWHLDWLNWAGAGLFVALGLFWVVVATGSAWSLRTGAAWKPLSPGPGQHGTEASKLAAAEASTADGAFSSAS